MSAAALQVQVKVTEGPHAGMSTVWTRPGRYSVGRHEQAALSLPYDLLAAEHQCQIEVTESGCVLQHLSNTSGTQINGSPASRTLLHSGDRVRFGMTELRIDVEQAAEPPPTVLKRGGFGTLAPTLVTSAASSTATTALSAVPGYRLIRKLGEGAMGVVYEAEQLSTRQRVALKTIIPAPGASRGAVQMFLREAEIMAQLQHPRIVRFIESAHHAGRVIFAMELIDAVDVKTLTQKLTATQRTPFFCGIVRQVLDALSFAHERGFVHRDVKPGNILIGRNGLRWQAKLADFGLAKNFQLAGISQITEDGDVKGTLAFMPPEQRLDSRYAKPAVDIYAAAATLYYFLAGASPFRTLPRTIQDIRGGDTTVIPLNEVRPDLPPPLIEVLHRALSANPRDRYATATELRSALHPFAR
ncbi:MAG TPA: FHA domain-containing serine/threonine-protein kinase [Planctomycetaceae bacterium]|nr:FHA domain-containing serine/threonine-protein kinase [Planctomycetaceae bacterium]